MAFHQAYGKVVHRTTPLHGYSAIHLVERFTGGRWELAAGLPRDAEEITEDAAREILGDAAGEPSRFALAPEAGTTGGLSAWPDRLDSMIDATVEWLRATAVGSDTELAWARYQSWDHDFELDTQEALRDTASLLSRMVEQRARLAARAEMRRARDVD
ncbi:hypothetical protein ACIQUM_00700 [Amycolatopsis azurea]|uniref:hypothetical protein n=1 Tax=Amycolatopsis azurea TaxID=36819 RepID=UPI0037FA7C4B